MQKEMLVLLKGVMTINIFNIKIIENIICKFQ